MKLPRFTRFERRIAVAILVTGALPLVATLLLGRGLLRDAYQVGVNARVGRALDRSLVAQRENLALLREQCEHETSTVAFRLSQKPTTAATELSRWRLEQPLLVHAQATLVSTSERLATVGNVANEGSLLAEVSHGDVRLTARFATPKALVEYEETGKTVAVFEQLRRGGDNIVGAFLTGFSIVAALLVLFSLAFGLALARRVTRRVVMVADATRAVAEGKLDVQLPVISDDEVADLTRAFNDMVLELSLSRNRIAYLQRVGAWQEFARRLAHEIKNPLTPIQLAMQQAHRAYEGDDIRYRKVIDDARAIIEEEVATLRQLVGEFSSFAKLPEAKLEQADLTEFARETLRAVGAHVDALNHELGSSVELTGELPIDAIPVRLDVLMLRRAIDNLVRNSVQAIAGNSTDKRGRVVLSVIREDDIACIEIRDNGPGVPTDDVMKIFEAYFTTKRDGTGLGLAIVRKIVLEHQGEIEYNGEEGKGAMFRIRLPVAAPGTSPEDLKRSVLKISALGITPGARGRLATTPSSGSARGTAGTNS